MPARRKPDEMKLLHGTWRPDRAAPDHVELPLVEGMPLPPVWLTNVHALDEWRRLVPVLVANRLLTQASLATFAHLSALHGALVQLSITPCLRHRSWLSTEHWRTISPSPMPDSRNCRHLRLPLPVARTPSPSSERTRLEASRTAPAHRSCERPSRRFGCPWPARAAPGGPSGRRRRTTRSAARGRFGARERASGTQ